MQSQEIINLLIIAIIISKMIIGILLYALTRKNRILKQEKTKLLDSYNQLKEQGAQIKKNNEELKASELFKTKVLSITSHDLRTPFASIDMLLHVNNLSDMSKSELEKILAELGKQVSISKNMLNEVLLWAESQLRDNLENKESFLISQQINTILSLFQHNLTGNNIVMINTVPQHLSIYMSRDIFSFVIRNIISNAIKFCHIEGTIKIGIQESKYDECKLFIENEGNQISEATILNLNNRNSWDYKKTENHSGAGLGISLCKDLLQRVGGSLQFDNRNPGIITVYISLPIELNEMVMTAPLSASL